jgi:hypothetical protein
VQAEVNEVNLNLFQWTNDYVYTDQGAYTGGISGWLISGYIDWASGCALVAGNQGSGVGAALCAYY